MRFRLGLIASSVLTGCLLAGCSNPPPPVVDPATTPEALEKARAEELKRLEGTWVLKSSQVAAELGAYSLLPSDGSEMVYRIRDGVMEMRADGETWLKYATLAIGTEPECLLTSQTDAVGKVRVVPLRYKLDGDNLVTAQDNLFPDQLAESFDLPAGVSHQRQVKTYVRKKK